jgi:hypothetical protein
MDSDALFHLHQIRLQNIHDTSCFHAMITGSINANLNDVLRYNGIDANDTRDKSVYTRNPAFWAQRPLTETMKDWAAADVNRLLDVAEKQLACLGEVGKRDAFRDSTAQISFARDMQLKNGLRVKTNIGRFIGKGGANIRRLEKRTGALMYQNREKGTWFVYYPSVSALRTVERAMPGYDDD